MFYQSNFCHFFLSGFMNPSTTQTLSQLSKSNFDSLAPTGVKLLQLTLRVLSVNVKGVMRVQVVLFLMHNQGSRSLNWTIRKFEIAITISS